jgi:hypothetical protein
MTLFEQWELVNFIANKDYEGNVVTPDRFAQLCKVVNMDLFKVKMGLPEDYQPGAPISRQYLDATQRLTDETRFLKTRVPAQSVASGVVAFPGNYFGFDAIRYGYQRTVDGSPKVIWKPVEPLTEDEYSDRAGNSIKEPTAKNPVCVIRSNGIHIYPTSIVQVDFNYVRYPVDPVFDYDENAGYITEGTSPTEYEWPVHLHRDLTMMILSYMAMNIREQQLEKYAEQHKAQGI